QMPEIGERFLGTVVKTTTFGAFISLLPGKDGLLHISEIRKLVGGKRIDAVEDVLAVGQKVQVELKEIDPRGKLSLGAVVADSANGAGGSADAAGGDVAGDGGAAADPTGEVPAVSVSDGAGPVEEEATPAAPDHVPAAPEDDSTADSDEGEGRERSRRNRRRRGGRGRGGSEGS